jgi:putative ABC transport system substrate-binding protein
MPVIGILNGASAELSRHYSDQVHPIVFVTGSDPVEQGLVGNLHRPESNITGVTTLAVELGQKRMEIMRELTPAANLFGVLINPKGPNVASVSRDLEAAARIIGLPIHVVHASTERELDAALAPLVALRASALVIGTEKPSDLPVQQSTKAELS